MKLFSRTFRHLNRLALICFFALVAKTAIAEPPSDVPAGFPQLQLPAKSHGNAAIAALGARLPELAAFYRLSPAALRKLFAEDASLWVDERGRLLYVCDWKIPEATNKTSNIQPLANSPAGYPYEHTFRLHSRPGATKIIYLDFDGHDASSTSWGSDSIARPFDTDGDPSTFSNAERDRIQYIWHRVSEDFALYDIDVTTEDPGVEALRKATTSDVNYGIRVGIGGSSGDWYGSAGGVAYVGSFNLSSDTPCWVFPKSLGDSEKNIAEATSHEVGHTLGLNHDGQVNVGNGYYYGHGNWAPIMGVGYNEPTVQWSRGEYTLANNQQDDLNVMPNYGVVFRNDDHANSILGATALVGPTLNGIGNIERTTDLDYFAIQTGAGRVTVTATPSARSPNLHVLLSLYNSSGALLIATNTPDTTAGTRPVSVSMILPAGTYYASIDGIGEANPLTNGYSDYGSLGQYAITGALPSDSGWLPIAGGNYSWTNIANWASNTVPLGAGVTARFVNNIFGDQFVALDQPLMIGRMFVGDSDGSNPFTFQGSALTFHSTGGPAGLTKLGSANDVFTMPLVLQTNLFVTNDAVGTLTFGGNVSGSGGLTKTGSGRLILEGTNIFSGGTVVSGGTLALGSAASISSSLLDVKANASFDVSAIESGFALNNNQTLAGNGALLGNVLAQPGSRIVAGGQGAAGTLAFSNQLYLASGSTLHFDIANDTTPGSGTNDLIVVNGDLELGVGLNCEFNFLNGGPLSPGAYTLIRYTGALMGGASNLVALTASNRFALTFDDTTPGEIIVHISGAPASLVWAGDGALNRWDVQGATNWLDLGNPETFAQLDSVSFDDSGSVSPNVNLLGAVKPAAITVNAAANYTFAGAGKISGNASLTKNGVGKLTLITANDFTGAVAVVAGTLQTGNGSALGATNGGTSIGVGAILDLNAMNLGAEPVAVAGTITNGSAATQSNALRFVTLTGNATFGGNGRWDIRANTNGSLTGNFNLTKTGPNEIWLANLGATGLGDILVQQGLLGFEDSTTMGNTTNSMMLSPNTTLALAYTDVNALLKKLFMTNAAIRSDAGNNIFAGTINVNGSNTFTTGAGLTLSGVVSGDGNLTKLGSGILSLSAANTFTGTARITAGTVRIRNTSALGTTNGATVIAGGRLDLNGISVGAEPVSASGAGLGNAGAIINYGGMQNNAIRFVTLTANTTFGGIGRWDIRANPTASFVGNNFNLTKTGPNEIWLVDVGQTGLGSITVNEGLLGIQGSSTLGNAASTLTVSSRSLGIWGTGTNWLNKVTTLSSARVYNANGANVFIGPITLSGSNNFDIASATTLTVSNVISGSGSLHSVSSGTLVLASNNTYSGVTRIAAGTLQIGAGRWAGTLGTGNVTNNAALVFNRSNDFTTANFITGSGSITKLGAGNLTLSGANNYDGPTTISAGAIKVGNASALGSLTNGTTVGSGATLDVNGFNLGAEAINVSGSGVAGNGAIVNNGALQATALRFVTLLGNTTFGGVNRWDIRDPGAGGASALSGSFSLTKVSSNQIWLANLGATTLQSIFVNGGLLVVQGTTTLGNPATVLNVASGATFGISAAGANVLNKIVSLNNAIFWNGSGSNTFAGGITLNGTNRVDVAAGSTLVLSGVISGAGDLFKVNPGTLLLTANETFSGNTIVNGGTLLLSAGSALGSPVIQVDSGGVLEVNAIGSFALAPSQTLRGNGTVRGNVTANGIIAPGTSIGKLSFNDSLTLAGTLNIEVSKTGGAATNDVLSVGSTLTLGGELNVTHSGDALANGDTFPLFSAGAFAGSFTSQNLPALSAGLRWDDGLLATSGVLSVAPISAPTILPPTYDGTNLVMQISSENGVTYVLEASPSLDAPVTWTGVVTNSGTGGVLDFLVPVDTAEPQHYFRINAF